MTNEVDLRDRPEEKYREELFDEVGKVDTDETIGVVSNRDLDPSLIRYQIENDRILEWEHAHSDAEPRKLQVTVGGPLGDDSLAVIDVRDLKPQRRHEVLLEIFNELQADEGFTLLNDHDPKPLYHELKSMHGDVVDWEYESRQSGEWRVEIVKADNSEADDEDIITRYDVRDIPKQERHPTIHHRYGMIPEGGTLELVAAHEPRPLHQEFRNQYGDSFTWDVIETEPGRCRVQVTKDNSVDEANETSDSEATVT
jgi:uncharacterized protein (DUF2249 family)